jgi:hypothetical protein
VDENTPVTTAERAGRLRDMTDDSGGRTEIVRDPRDQSRDREHR